MSELKATPGPWKIVETVDPSMVPDYHIKIGDDQISIFPYKRSYSEDGIQSGLIFDGEKIANANLIAAAPELYEALVDMHRTQLNNNRHDPDDYENTEQFLRVTAALAKARGESHD